MNQAIISKIEEFKREHGVNRRIAKLKNCSVEQVHEEDDPLIGEYTIEYIEGIEIKRKRTWKFREQQRGGTETD